MLRRIWHDPVWSKVIATGLCVAIPWVVNRLFHWWSWSALFIKFENALRKGWAFALSTSPTPHWLIGLAGLVIILFIAVLVSALMPTARSEEQILPIGRSAGLDQPAWHAYTTDTFYKVRWRWTYENSGQATIPVCFCPRCNCQLVVHNLGQMTGMDTSGFYCVSCDKYVEKIDKSLDEVEQGVTLLIQKNPRNGTWADVVRNDSAGANS